MVLEDGVSHPVDSSEIAFKMAAMGALRQGTLDICAWLVLILGVCLLGKRRFLY